LIADADFNADADHLLLMLISLDGLSLGPASQ
jgi:hypothetical protein